MGINWQDIAAIVVIISAILGTGVIYLKMFVRQEFQSMKKELITKELFEAKIDSVNNRIKRLEERVTQLRGRGNG